MRAPITIKDLRAQGRGRTRLFAFFFSCFWKRAKEFGSSKRVAVVPLH